MLRLHCHSSPQTFALDTQKHTQKRLQINNLSDVAQNENNPAPDLVKGKNKPQNGNYTHRETAARGHSKQTGKKTKTVRVELKNGILNSENH